MSDYSKFDSMFDLEGLKSDIKEAAERNFERVEVPDDQYECRVEKMEMKESKSGNPMLTIWFRIVAGSFKNSMLFCNQSLHTGFGLHKAKTMLASLDSGAEIDFQSFSQFGHLIDEVYSRITAAGLEYAVKYTTTKGDFKNFEIMEVYYPQK